MTHEEIENLYRCRTCRARNFHRESRICLLDRDEAIVERMDESSGGWALYLVDREILPLILGDGLDDNLIEEIRRLGRGGLELCFVPFVYPEAEEIFSDEIEAETYGGGPPSTRRRVLAYRILRHEKAKARAAMNQRLRARAAQGGGH